jgi:hypothetical protein
MRQWRKIVGVLTSVAVLITGAAVLESRAADQSAAGGNRTGNQPSRPQAADTAAPKGSAIKPAAPGAPQVPEESATVRDDPTVAPDPKQSADNNVSFPNDT